MSRVPSFCCVAACAAIACGADDGPDERGECARFATRVSEFEFGASSGVASAKFGQGPGEFPERVLGGPRGAGCCAGSQDVTSLGNGGFVVLEAEGTEIVDGPGADFIVFENAFWRGGDESRVFAEIATVAVSADDVVWNEFECTASAPPYGSCAGWHPTLANVDSNDLDPGDPGIAGGDPFDLADLGVEAARFVRITDRADLSGALDGVFDLDAVAIVHARCP